VLGYAALFSALLSERGKAAGLATGVTLGGYLAFIVSGISPRWEFLKFVSIFSAYKPQDALAHGSLNITGVAILVALGLACCIAALIQFERRDMI
jgi:ABC-2 type transport system permease protein